MRRNTLKNSQLDKVEPANPVAELGHPKLWKIRSAVVVSTTAAFVALISLTFVAWIVLRHPKLPHPKNISLSDTVSVLQLMFASVAGAGALIALIVAYRRQKLSEAASELERYRAGLDRTRVFNERFTAAAAQLGDDHPAIRLAGVHAMAGLADDWDEGRQTCIDVLCAYLRMPYTPDPGEQAPIAEQLDFGAFREVRHSLIRVIRRHLIDGVNPSWQGMNLDFTGVVFDGGDFSHVTFAEVSSRGYASFDKAQFRGPVSFNNAQFNGRITFNGATFADGYVDFSGVTFKETVEFQADFAGGAVHFDASNFNGGTIDFRYANFSAGEVSFSYARFSGSSVDFSGSTFSGSKVDFTMAEFKSGQVSFGSILDPELWQKHGEVEFTTFSGSEIDFGGAKFMGADVSFSDAEFSGGRLDFTHVSQWTDPPSFSEIPSIIVEMTEEQRRLAEESKRRVRRL